MDMAQWQHPAWGEIGLVPSALPCLRKNRALFNVFSTVNSVVRFIRKVEQTQLLTLVWMRVG